MLGVGTNAITLDDLRRPTSEAYKFLQLLGQNMAIGAEIDLEHCRIATGPEGREFIH